MQEYQKGPLIVGRTRKSVVRNWSQVLCNQHCHAFQTPTDLEKLYDYHHRSQTTVNKMPSASKEKRLAEKAAKKNAGGISNGTNSEDLMSMARLNIATDRYGLLNFDPPWLFFQIEFIGVLLVFWFLMSKVEISKLIRILCLSMEDYLSRVLRLLLTTDSDMVYLERMALER